MDYLENNMTFVLHCRLQKEYYFCKNSFPLGDYSISFRILMNRWYSMSTLSNKTSNISGVSLV